jgi:hypothetical protein
MLQSLSKVAESIAESKRDKSSPYTQEFLQLRQLWLALWDRVSILDELGMVRHVRLPSH